MLERLNAYLKGSPAAGIALGVCAGLVSAWVVINALSLLLNPAIDRLKTRIAYHPEIRIAIFLLGLAVALIMFTGMRVKRKALRYVLWVIFGIIAVLSVMVILFP